ncbi:MAG: Trk system potassium transport protein TrkA [Planctomycetota bacterium]
MKVVIVGAGQVGFHIADRLSREGHDVTVIEKSSEKEADLKRKLNVLVARGSGASAELLDQVGIEGSDLFIAVTDQDEVNLIACMLAGEFKVPVMIARIKNPEYTHAEWKTNAEKMGIDLMINPESVVAEDICEVVAHTAATHAAEFADGRVVFLGYPVVADSPLAGITLRELGDLRGIYRLVVTAIARGEETLVPRGDDSIEAGDKLYFICEKGDVPSINYLFGFEKRQTKSVFVLGAGRVGSEVSRRLSKQKYRVKVIDRNPEQCTLRNEGIEEGDVYIAATQDAQTNILCSLLAKRYGAKRVIALVNERQYVSLAPSLGVDVCISPRLATASAILKYVRRGEVLSVDMVEACEAEVMELILPSERRVIGKKLSAINFPRGSIIGAVMRGDEILVPSGDDCLLAGDRVIVFALPDAVAKVEKFFSR